MYQLCDRQTLAKVVTLLVDTVSFCTAWDGRPAWQEPERCSKYRAAHHASAQQRRSSFARRPLDVPRLVAPYAGTASPRRCVTQLRCKIVAQLSGTIVSPPFPTRADVFWPNHSKRHRVTHNTHACWAPLLTATLHTLQASRQDAAKQALQNLFEGAKDILAVNEKAELEAQQAAGGGGGSGGKGGGDSGGGDGFNWRGGPGDYWHAFCNCANLSHSLPAAFLAHCA